jgi:hypothetical protein
MSPDLPFDTKTPFAGGQRLQCESCGAEIEVVQPCPCNPPTQELRCCGQDMVPIQGIPRRLDTESETAPLNP